MAESLARGNRYIAHTVASTRAEVLGADGLLDQTLNVIRRNARTCEETFGPAHLFSQETRKDLNEFEGCKAQPIRRCALSCLVVERSPSAVVSPEIDVPPALFPVRSTPTRRLPRDGQMRWGRVYPGKG